MKRKPENERLKLGKKKGKETVANLKETLEVLHTGLADELLQRIKSGEATSADLSVARQFLKDNGIDAYATPDSPLGELITQLPFVDDDGIIQKPN